jgi:hypothetical protein
MLGKAISIGLFVVAAVVLFFVGSTRQGALPPPPPPPAPAPEVPAVMSYPLTAQLVISAVLLVAALFVILTKKYPPQDKHWAYGALGTVVGFWLKAPA